MTDDTDPTDGSQYRHDDGTIEVVFAVEEGRVLAVREYPTVKAFEGAVAAATDAGVHEGVADLPDASVFEEGIEDDE